MFLQCAASLAKLPSHILDVIALTGSLLLGLCWSLLPRQQDIMAKLSIELNIATLRDNQSTY
jgi:hypothetical protein